MVILPKTSLPCTSWYQKYFDFFCIRHKYLCDMYANSNINIFFNDIIKLLHINCYDAYKYDYYMLHKLNQKKVQEHCWSANSALVSITIKQYCQPVFQNSSCIDKCVILEISLGLNYSVSTILVIWLLCILTQIFVLHNWELIFEYTKLTAGTKRFSSK